MRTIASFIRFIINGVLFVAGSLLILAAVVWYNSSSIPNDPRIIIENGPLRGQAPSGFEARTLYTMLSTRAEEINTRLSDDPALVSFDIEPGDHAQSAAERLQTMGLIHDAELFGQLLRYNDIDTKLIAGNYQLRRNMTMKEIGATLYKGNSARITVTIPAGWRMEQVAEYLQTAEIMDGNQFLREAHRGMIVNHDLLADRPPGHSYEGFLFPDTYLVLDSVTPKDLIAGMLDNMARKLPANTLDLARKQGLTFYEVLTLASIVERETILSQERPIVASVYLNRLNPANQEIYLKADPTVQYAMGYQPDTGQWWKSPVRLEEYNEVDSPYNTYLYPGLPPGPIASPSLASIMAVLQPADTDYLFFVCRRPGCEGGEHVFAETYQEHLQNVAIYWEQQ